MEFIVNNWILFLVAVGSGSWLFWTHFINGEGNHHLAPYALVQLMNKEKVWLIDLRSADQFSQGHIK
ncbi:MAG: rhodanese-like domain-containing protein, partial [Gammaproteobacteria bacterium]|nr:rhodanese-like domain-containing protein [Gammaproteobacteria bacterium]